MLALRRHGPTPTRNRTRGTAGTGKSHTLIALGHAAVAAGMRVRCFAAADLVEALYRGMADDSVARIIDSLLRADLVIATSWASPLST